MVKSSKTSSQGDGVNLLLSLREQQTKVSEHSPSWVELQMKIDSIIAQNYLEWVNS